MNIWEAAINRLDEADFGFDKNDPRHKRAAASYSSSSTKEPVELSPDEARIVAMLARDVHKKNIFHSDKDRAALESLLKKLDPEYSKRFEED